MKKPLVLTIMDGFGFNDNNDVNAIYAAKTQIAKILKDPRRF